jgi:hypothetical protein
MSCMYDEQRVVLTSSLAAVIASREEAIAA